MTDPRPGTSQPPVPPDELEDWLSDLRADLSVDPPGWLDPGARDGSDPGGADDRDPPALPAAAGEHTRPEVSWWEPRRVADPPGGLARPAAGRHRAAD